MSAVMSGSTDSWCVRGKWANPGENMHEFRGDSDSLSCIRAEGPALWDRISAPYRCPSRSHPRCNGIRHTCRLRPPFSAWVLLKSPDYPITRLRQQPAASGRTPSAACSPSRSPGRTLCSGRPADAPVRPGCGSSAAAGQLGGRRGRPGSACDQLRTF